MLLALLQGFKDKVKKWAITAGVIVLVLIGYHFARKWQQNRNAVIQNPVLQPTEREAIIIDPPRHQIEVITPTGSTKSFFPDQPSRISIGKDGKVKIISPTWDFGLHPTIGFGVADRPKLFVGVSPLGWKKLELNTGLETDCKELSETAIDLSLGYNVHNSTYLFFGVNTHKDPIGGLRFRF